MTSTASAAQNLVQDLSGLQCAGPEFSFHPSSQFPATQSHRARAAGASATAKGRRRGHDNKPCQKQHHTKTAFVLERTLRE